MGTGVQKMIHHRATEITEKKDLNARKTWSQPPGLSWPDDLSQACETLGIRLNVFCSLDFRFLCDLCGSVVNHPNQ
jgi:hypothetical protein